MVLRKIIQFNTVLGLTLPKQFTGELELKKGSYVEVYLRDKRTIVIKAHKREPKKITLDDK